MIAFLAAQLIALAAGVFLMAAIGARGMPLGLFVPAAWLGGTGLLAAEHLVLAQAGVPWNPLTLGLPWLIVAGLAVRRVRIDSNSFVSKPDLVGKLRAGFMSRQSPMKSGLIPGSRSPIPDLLLEVLVGILLLAWTAKMLIIATSKPPVGWDALVDWLFKGRAMY